MVLFYKKKRKSLLSYVNSKGIYCDSFMLKPSFFEATKGKSLDEQASLLASLSRLGIDEKHFDFLLNLYKNYYENFKKIMSFEDGSDFSDISDDFMSVCNQNKEAMDVLITLSCAQHKNLLNPKIYDVYGKEVILANLNIIDDNFEKLLPYIEVIKSNPSRYPLILQISKLNDEKNKNALMENLDKLASVPQATDIIENFEKFGRLQKTAILDNLDDKEVIDFCLNNPNIIFDSAHFISSFKKWYCSIHNESVPVKLIKKLNMASLINEDSLNVLCDKALSSLFIENEVSMVKLERILREAREKHYEFSVEAGLIEEFIKKIEGKENTKEDIIEIVKEYSLFSEVNYDEIYRKTLEWIQEFEAFELNKNLLDLSKRKPSYSISYTYIDEDGLEANKDIPIFVLDTPNFHVLYHNIVEKSPTITQIAGHYYDSAVSFSNFIKDLINNPSFFNNMQGIYNPNISLSYGKNCINTFGKPSILCGFSHIDAKRLLKTFRLDGGTSMTKKEKLEGPTFESCDDLGKSNVYRDYSLYSEVLEKRYLDGNNINIDYMMYIIDGDYRDFKDPKIPFELTKKWAAYYNVPILMVDGPALKKKHCDRFNSLLKLYDNLDVVSFSMINEIFEERYYFNHFQDKNITHILSVYELTDRLFANKELNYNTAQNFVTLVDKLSSNYEWCVGETVQETEERKQKMQQYYNKCREVIKNSELSMSEDTYNNDKRL